MSMQTEARVAELERRIKELESAMTELTRIMCAPPQPRETLHVPKSKPSRAPI